MFGYDVLKIGAILDDCSSKLKNLKSLSVRMQHYEHTAKLREVEKQLEDVAKHLSTITYAETTKGLTPKGRLFYNQLFHYGICTNWKPLPENMRSLLAERKGELNGQIEFDDENVDTLLKLNRRLTTLEKRIDEFYKYMQHDLHEKGIADCLNDGNAGGFTLKCFTQGKAYEFNTGSFNNDLPFYQLQFSLDELRVQSDVCGGVAIPDYLTHLPIRLREENFCRLFTYLATRGLLAWADFLNISHIKIDLKVGYRFTDNNMTK